MSIRRRAAAPRLIEWTGERCVPWAPDVQVVYEHFHRYLWAARVVGGRRVLDLGSGEGFGAAILAESAEHVVGIDIDELTVEHSRLNYASENLEFDVGTALDLSVHADGSFGAVVAYEIIEHVREQERVLAEVARVLAEDGILVISTPDRRMYGETRGEPNRFHERELNLDEFLELLGEYFPHLASWGQRTITGSHLNPLDYPARDGKIESSDFFIERAGDEWRVAAGPAPLYCVALASRAPLPVLGPNSTLADCGLELMRVKERDAAMVRGEEEALARRIDDVKQRLEREKDELSLLVTNERDDHMRDLRDFETQLHEEREQRAQEIDVTQEAIVRGKQTVERNEQAIRELQGLVASLEAQMAAARRASRRMEESVTWQAFEKVRARLYRTIGGERSLLARALGSCLRLAGRAFVDRSPVMAPTSEQVAAPASPELIRVPEYRDPEVSLIIPLHAHAELTRACLRSILDHTTGARYEVILVDDAADSDTKKLLDGVRGANIIRNDNNLGYLRSVNRAATVARGQWVVLFNNDTEVRPKWLSAMLDCARSAPDVGVVTPKYIYADGTLNEAGGIIWRDGTGVNYGRGDAPDRFQYEYRRDTDYGSAAALMVSAELWNSAGGFDERYLPMYYEDTDLCFEARERGFRVLYEPEAVVVHIEGATAGNDPGSGHKRYQEQNRHKFVSKWRHRLEAEHRYPAPASVRAAADRNHGQHVLVIDHRVPMWDRDSGSLRMLGIIEALIGLGARVTFLPDNLARVQPYTRYLQRLGIEVWYSPVDVKAELAAIGPSLRTAILCRPHAAGHWLDAVREFAPGARVVYDTVDLHWLREGRRSAIEAPNVGALTGSNGSIDPDSISPKAKSLRELELAMIRATDVTLVVSDCERVQVERDVPGSNVLVVPNVHDVEDYVPPFERRSGILFVGSFEHVPNIDAAIRLVTEVMPPVWRELGDVHVTIVGTGPPLEVQALASQLVDVTGWVEDLKPLLERSRVMVAPLDYGAGLKGKVTQCLAAGLPVVTTPVGAEGLMTSDGEAILIAGDTRELAERVVHAYRDDKLWQSLSASGQSLVSRFCSREFIAHQMRLLLTGETIGESASDTGQLNRIGS